MFLYDWYVIDFYHYWENILTRGGYCRERSEDAQTESRLEEVTNKVFTGLDHGL